MIAIDCRVVGANTGVDYYTRDLVFYLAKVRSSKDITLLIASENQKEMLPGYTNFQLLPEKKVIIDHWRFYSLIKNQNYEVVVHPDNTAFISGHPKSIVVLHDVLPWKFPNQILSHRLLTNQKQKFYLTLQKFALQKAYQLITVSHSSRKDITDLLKIPSEKISVVYESVGDHFQPATNEDASLGKKFKLTKKFIFYIGGFEINKNIINLLKAYEISASDSLLVLAGDLDKYPEKIAILSMIKEMKKAENIKLVGKLSDQDLVRFYQQAAFFIYPALYGGFGRPILEALKSGCVVACSQSSSYPEVASSAGHYFDPKDTDSIVSVINKLDILTSNTQSLKKLKSVSLNQAKKFDWLESAGKIWDIIDKVAAAK